MTLDADPWVTMESCCGHGGLVLVRGRLVDGGLVLVRGRLVESSVGRNVYRRKECVST